MAGWFLTETTGEEAGAVGDPLTPLSMRLPWPRRAVVAVVRRRPAWAATYVRRQLRLADEALAATTQLADHVERAADEAERTPLRRLAERHRALRTELYVAVRHVEQRLARSGAYQLEAAGLVADTEAARALGYVAAEVRPALDRVAGELDATSTA